MGFTHPNPRSIAGQLKAEHSAPTPTRRAEIQRESTYTIRVFRLPHVAWTPPLPAAIFPARVTPRKSTFTIQDEGTYVLPDFGLTDRL